MNIWRKGIPNGWTWKYKCNSIYFLMRFWSIQLEIRWWT